MPTAAGDDEPADIEGHYFYNVYTGCQVTPCPPCKAECTFTGEHRQSFPIPMDCTCRLKDEAGLTGTLPYVYLNAFRAYWMLPPRGYKVAKLMPLPDGVPQYRLKYFPEQVIPGHIAAEGIMHSLDALLWKDWNILVFSPLLNAYKGLNVRKYPQLLEAIQAMHWQKLPEELHELLGKHGITDISQLTDFISDYKEIVEEYEVLPAARRNVVRKRLFDCTTPVTDATQPIYYEKKDKFERDPSFANLPQQQQDSFNSATWLNDQPPEVGIGWESSWMQVQGKVKARFRECSEADGQQPQMLPYVVWHGQTINDTAVLNCFCTLPQLKTAILEHVESQISARFYSQATQEAYLKRSFDREDYLFLQRHMTIVQLLTEEYLALAAPRNTLTDRPFTILDWNHLIDMIEVVTNARKVRHEALYKEEAYARRQAVLTSLVQRELRAQLKRQTELQNQIQLESLTARIRDIRNRHGQTNVPYWMLHSQKILKEFRPSSLQLRDAAAAKRAEDMLEAIGYPEGAAVARPYAHGCAVDSKGGEGGEHVSAPPATAATGLAAAAGRTVGRHGRVVRHPGPPRGGRVDLQGHGSLDYRRDRRTERTDK